MKHRGETYRRNVERLKAAGWNDPIVIHRLAVHMTEKESR